MSDQVAECGLIKRDSIGIDPLRSPKITNKSPSFSKKNFDYLKRLLLQNSLNHWPQAESDLSQSQTFGSVRLDNCKYNH